MSSSVPAKTSYTQHSCGRSGRTPSSSSCMFWQSEICLSPAINLISSCLHVYAWPQYHTSMKCHRFFHLYNSLLSDGTATIPILNMTDMRRLNHLTTRRRQWILQSVRFEGTATTIVSCADDQNKSLIPKSPTLVMNAWSLSRLKIRGDDDWSWGTTKIGSVKLRWSLGTGFGSTRANNSRSHSSSSSLTALRSRLVCDGVGVNNSRSHSLSSSSVVSELTINSATDDLLSLNSWSTPQLCRTLQLSTPLSLRRYPT